MAAINLFRAIHDVPAVTWSDALAQDTANHFLNQKDLTYSGSFTLPPPLGPSGETLDLGDTRPTPIDAVRAWYAEVQHCASLPQGCQGPLTGHFTTLVWAGVEEIGCTTNGNNLAACRYKGSDTLTCKTPNMAGAFETNVFPSTQTLDAAKAKLTACGLPVPLFAPNAWEGAPPPPLFPAPVTPAPAPAPVAPAPTAPVTFPPTLAPAPPALPIAGLAPHQVLSGSMNVDPIEAQLLARNHAQGKWSVEDVKPTRESTSIPAFAAGALFASVSLAVLSVVRRGSQTQPLASEVVVE